MANTQKRDQTGRFARGGSIRQKKTGPTKKRKPTRSRAQIHKAALKHKKAALHRKRLNAKMSRFNATTTKHTAAKSSGGSGFQSASLSKARSHYMKKGK